VAGNEYGTCSKVGPGRSDLCGGPSANATLFGEGCVLREVYRAAIGRGRFFVANSTERNEDLVGVHLLAATVTRRWEFLSIPDGLHVSQEPCRPKISKFRYSSRSKCEHL